MTTKDTIKEPEVRISKSTVRRGMIEYLTLLAVSKQKIYATSNQSELRLDNVFIIEGAMYPLFSRLRGEGLLEYFFDEPKTKFPRKYYSLTERGKAKLSDLTITWKPFMKLLDKNIKK